MTEVVSSLQRVLNVRGAPAFAAALAAVCLVQYLLHLYYARGARRENRRIRRELESMVDRVMCLESDRALAETESRVLRRLAEVTTADEAVRVVLQCCVPEPEAALAAWYEVRPEGRPWLRAAYGLSDESCARIAAEPNWLSRLAGESSLRLWTEEARMTTFYRQLSPEDQSKVRELIVLRVGPPGRPLGIVVTTTLAPEGTSFAGRLELMERLLSTLVGLLQRTEALTQQQDELRLTRELLDLRCLVDTHLGTPIELLEEFLGRLVIAAGFDRGTLCLASGKRLDPKPLVSSGDGLPRGIVDLWKLDEAVLARQGLEATGLAFFPATELRSLPIRSTMRGALVAPLMHEDSLIAVVCLTRQSETPLADADRELLRWATEYLTETILRTVDRAIIEQQARRDALTQLANRHTFDREIDRHVARAERTEEPCSLIMLDIDRFKLLNDRYGHLAGDEVLRCVARMVQSCAARTRAADRPLVARYGGEELSVLLPGIGLDGAYRVAEDILSTVRRKAVDFEGRVIRMTASAGVAVCPQHGITPSELIAAADAALYRAKQAGRDRCEVAAAGRAPSERLAAYGVGG
jgi:diguanylate cyclase (GGDEF)-like protein